MNVIEQLIDDTLFARRIESQGGSCLVVNAAGMELLSCQANVTSEIEVVIRQIDQAVCESPANVGQFVGLKYLIGGYLVNAARHDPHQAVEFIQTLCRTLVREFIANLPVFFRRIESGYNFGVPIPAEYLELARNNTNAADSGVAGNK